MKGRKTIEVDFIPNEVMKKEMEIAAEKAHKALSHYKFQMFGYWAAIWVHLNHIGKFKLPNPFALYVKLAKKEVEFDERNKSS